MAFHAKGQGATEYLVILAVVLIIALVAISILGVFPGMASDAKITQSATYWRGQARPISILASSFSKTGNGNITVSNNDAIGALHVTNMTFNSDDGTTGSLGASFWISPGSQTTVQINTVAISKNDGDPYAFTVIIHYNDAGGLSQTEYGAAPLAGKYTTG